MSACARQASWRPQARWYTAGKPVTSPIAASRAALAGTPPGVVPLSAAAVAYLAAQGFGRFGFGLVLPAMRDALGLSTGEMGLLAGIGLAAYLFSSVPAGALAARFGTRWVVVGAVARWVLASLLASHIHRASSLQEFLADPERPLQRWQSDIVVWCLRELGAGRVIPDASIAKVSLVGAGMKSNPGVAATVFETLAANDINIEMISTSAIRISVVVAGDECDRAVTVLHTAFGLDAPA